MKRKRVKIENLKKRRSEAGEEVASQGEGGQPGQTEENLMMMMVMMTMLMMMMMMVMMGQTQKNLASPLAS